LFFSRIGLSYLELVWHIEVPNLHLLKWADFVVDRESPVEQFLDLYTQLNYENFDTRSSDWRM